jgi:hypothetical protein
MRNLKMNTVEKNINFRLTISHTAIILSLTHYVSEFMETAAAFTEIIFLFTALTVNSSVWEALGCATHNISKDTYTSKGSYFR